ncbi:MAG: ferrous iron transport protein B [Limnochordia bacterium]|jgi:ferrous iron transport protein B
MASCHQVTGLGTAKDTAQRGRASTNGHVAPTEQKRIILAGNPNCGKSVLFNRLTGLYVNVSNFPGTTVDISKGTWLGAALIDTPGVYGLGSYSDEERIARDAVFTADVVVNVVNVTSLSRDLFLTLQLVDAGVPLVVALNMMDEAEAMGLKVDVKALAKALGVPVIPIVAIHGKGLTELAAAVAEARPGIPGKQVVSAIRQVKERAGSASRISSAESLLIAENDAEVAQRYQVEPCNLRAEIYTERRQRADRLANDVMTGGEKRRFSSVLAAWTTRPLIGIPILALVLFALYWLVGVGIAQVLVGFTEETVMAGMYEPFISQLVGRFVGEESILYRLLVGEFGILTMTVTYALGLLLPLVGGFYLALAILEDSGYLPRIAVLTDKMLNRIGLNGRAIIPMILGLGCVTMATLTTRVLGSNRERIIASVLLGIAIPCSAQLAVTTALVIPLGWQATAAYLLVLVLVYGLIGAVLNRLLPGKSTDLIIDLPPLRLPRFSNVMKKTGARLSGFLLEATPIFAIGALAVSIMLETGILQWIQQLLAPITTVWLRLPAEASRAFVMGLMRRDFGAAGLYELAMTPQQTLVAVVTITLFVPCIASMLVFLKERGLREGLSIFFGSIVFSILTGGILTRVLALLPSFI